MKPCSNNRKLIAWLALGALEARQERDLRAHLESCPGCRSYLQEMSTVTEKLNVTPIRSDIEASESFHRRVVSALRAENTPRENVVAQLRAAWPNWRLAWPLTAAIVVLMAALSVFLRPPDRPSPAPISVQLQSGLTPSAQLDLNPTLSNYETVANRSLDKLDELLTRQGNRNPAPTPIYTASTLARASTLD
jgi:anti-sigma factor RsiW